MSKNAITIDQLRIACRHVEEMRAAGVTENLAIRTLELFADVYAKLRVVGNASPHHVDEVKLWSVKARQLRNAKPDAKPRDNFRVEHGTPRRGFAREVLALYRKDKLNERTIKELVKRHWKPCRHHARRGPTSQQNRAITDVRYARGTMEEGRHRVIRGARLPSSLQQAQGNGQPAPGENDVAAN